MTNAKYIVLGVTIIVLLGIGLAFVEDKFGNGPPEPPENFPEHVRLKSHPNKVLDQKEIRPGVVHYYYDVDEYISDAVPNDVPGYVLNELKTKRTGKTKVFATNLPDKSVMTRFFSELQFYKDNENRWKKAEEATTTLDAYERQTGKDLHGPTAWLVKTVFATDSTFYPQPSGSETESVDGRINKNNGSTWQDNCNGSTGNYTADDEASATSAGVEDGGVDGWVSRNHYGFDTSAIGSDDISAATFSYVVSTKENGDNDGFDYHTLTTSTPASNTELAAGDYGNVGSTELTDQLDFGSITADGSTYNVLTFNDPDTDINKSGTSNFMLREGHDILCEVSKPAGTNRVNTDFSETGGTSTDPKLDVTHAPGAGGGAAGYSSVIIIAD